jgi:glycosyltransferase involved in cell wall biosynthesis
VLLAGKLTALEASGGGEVQMAATGRALRDLGLDARCWRPWEERLAGVRLLHLFGSLPEHPAVVEAARRQRVPVVLSTIAWFSLAGYWAEPRPLVRRLAACAGLAVRCLWPRVRSWRRKLYQSVDLLLPNSHAEAEQLVRYFGVPMRRIHVVPNGADPRFRTADPEPFARQVGGPGFVLCAGRIEPRKNQRALLRALHGSGLRVVLLGGAVPGYEGYLAECRRVADERVQFVGPLEHDDPRLASAYAACGCLALCSWYETPGLAALEAGMSGAPLVLPHGGCAREYFGPHAEYVRPTDLRGIRRAVTEALLRGRSAELAEKVAGSFSWAAAARATLEAYRRVS